MLDSREAYCRFCLADGDWNFSRNKKQQEVPLLHFPLIFNYDNDLFLWALLLLLLSSILLGRANSDRCELFDILTLKLFSLFHGILGTAVEIPRRSITTVFDFHLNYFIFFTVIYILLSFIYIVIRLETKSCRISYRKLMVKCDRT